MPARTLTRDEHRDLQTPVPKPTPTTKDRRGPLPPRPDSTAAVRPSRPDLRPIGASRTTARLRLFTYIIGTALFWTLWAAISVTAERWYWWTVIPFVGWALVLAAHLWHASRPARPRAR